MNCYRPNPVQFAAGNPAISVCCANTVVLSAPTSEWASSIKSCQYLVNSSDQTVCQPLTHTLVSSVAGAAWKAHKASHPKGCPALWFNRGRSKGGDGVVDSVSALSRIMAALYPKGEVGLAGSGGGDTGDAIARSLAISASDQYGVGGYSRIDILAVTRCYSVVGTESARLGASLDIFFISSWPEHISDDGGMKMATTYAYGSSGIMGGPSTPWRILCLTNLQLDWITAHVGDCGTL
ncbi:hypothetical protein Tco_0602567 [Tanacetum coccineum]